MLVHDFWGRNRSGSVTIAWLMKKNNWTFKTAEEFVNSKRTIVLKDHFKDALKFWEFSLGDNLT